MTSSCPSETQSGVGNARLATGVGTTLAVFLFETHRDSRSKEGEDNAEFS